ncbi:MAG: GuaB3 family IMP dehydrogenase-related protein [Candidatus Nanopelagicales bacterium]
MSSIEIGRGKRARTAYSFDDIAVAPSRRTRNPDEVSTEWRIDAYRFATPILAAPMDSVVSPRSAAELSRLGALAVLNLEGLWTRYADPEPVLEQIRRLPAEDVVTGLQRAYATAPVDVDLIGQRVGELRETGGTVAVAVSPQHAAELSPYAVAAGIELLVIRGTTVSAEHVSTSGEPLNLKTFIYDLDVPVIVGGCSTYQAALHLMRTGAAGVLVGFGGGAAHTTFDVLGIRVPMATAVAEVAEARRDYLDESGGRYVHVIADGSVGSSGALVKALACGADAVMIGSVFARATDSPGQGVHWGAEAWHASLPRGERKELGTVGTLAQIMHGPSHTADGSANLVGALRKAMATTGYSELKEFQRIEVITSPS